LKVERFVTPEEFEEYKRLGMKLGFKYVMSGPLVRSSYIAEEGYKECVESLVRYHPDEPSSSEARGEEGSRDPSLR